MATMTAMAATVSMASTTTMVKTRGIMDERRCCESDHRHGVECIGGCSMNAALVASTMIDGIVFHTRSQSFLTYPRSTEFVSDAWIK